MGGTLDTGAVMQTGLSNERVSAKNYIMKAFQLPKKYPNVYFYDHNNHKFPTVTFIKFSATPSGRVGKDFTQFRVYIKPDGRFESMTLAEIASYANENIVLHRLRKGYTWGDLFIQHNYSTKTY